MTDEVRNKINCIVLDDLSKVQTMDVGSKERAAAIQDLKTLVEMDIADYEAGARAYKDEALVKAEKRKILIDNIVKGLGYAVYGGSTVLVLYASQKGWFIDRLPLGTVMKPKV